ncbi:MAG: peroxiredoxin family protein [Candidatus Sumerlaeaceae bacterium]
MLSHCIIRSLFCAKFVLIASMAVAVQEKQTTGSKQYNLSPGTRLVYETSGTLRVTGDVDRLESTSFRSAFTVLEQRPEGRVLLAEIDLLGKRDNAATVTQPQKIEPAARFTLSLPAEGAVPGETVQTAGLANPAFPGWKFESLFPPLPAEGKSTASMMLEMVGEIVNLEQHVSSVGNVTQIDANLTTATEKGLKQHSYTARFADAEFSLLETSQTTLVEIEPSPDMKALISLGFVTRRVDIQKLSAADMQKLGKDVAAAIPLATRIRSLNMSGEDAVKQTLKGIEDYLTQFPDGAFAPIYKRISVQVGQMRALQENSEKIAEGTSAPDFEATSIDGQKIKLSSYRGKVVLLDFWATWCGPCVGLIPDMKRIYDANQGKPFVLLGISADHEESALKEFVKKREVKWPQVFEGDPTSGTAMLAYGITKYPTTVLIDAQGQIRKVDAHGDELTQAIDDLIREAK